MGLRLSRFLSSWCLRRILLIKGDEIVMGGGGEGFVCGLRGGGLVCSVVYGRVIDGSLGDGDSEQKR
jgi:hypothetical protein